VTRNERRFYARIFARFARNQAASFQHYQIDNPTVAGCWIIAVRNLGLYVVLHAPALLVTDAFFVFSKECKQKRSDHLLTSAYTFRLFRCVCNYFSHELTFL